MYTVFVDKSIYLWKDKILIQMISQFQKIVIYFISNTSRAY